jgi:alpha-L-fucosidase
MCQLPSAEIHPVNAKTYHPHAWFREATYGLFIHWGPYAQYGRDPQALMRELRDQREYELKACAWKPVSCDFAQWARIAARGGFKYAVFTTRHHDGFCMWNTDTTDYSSARQAAGRDFVREYVDAFRAAGLSVGLYFSWNDFRIPAMFSGPQGDPAAWGKFVEYVHAQVRELMTRYGKIDVLWLDGVWPATAEEWRSAELVEEVRLLQPGILINNRLGFLSHKDEFSADQSDGGDFGTPEHRITPVSGRLWESCQVSTWRLWCHSFGERWRPTDVLLDLLTEASSKGGNLLLNVGPTANGEIPVEFIERSDAIGAWLRLHGEAVYGTQPVDAGETVLFGRQTRRGNTLYLIFRFWPGTPSIRFQGLATAVLRATLLTTGQDLSCRRETPDHALIIDGLPLQSPHPLFPVIKLELASEPRTLPSYHPGQWGGDPARLLAWARLRGDGFSVSQHLNPSAK